jgi:hypothetical protein
MTIDLPYYTGLLIVTGLIIVPVVHLVLKAIVELDKNQTARKKKK